AETADTIEEADRWSGGDMSARRPPELLTRDVVARAIMSEVAAGRGSPHGGAFLDIANRRDAEHIKRKLPSMYHQFKELAEIDITRDAMEVGPTCHYMMGGVRVDEDTQMTRVPGLFACGECGAGLHGANRLGGNSLSDLIVFGRLAGLGAKAYLEKAFDGALDEEAVAASFDRARAVLNREEGLNPYVLHDEIRDLMQRDVGIWRDDERLSKGIDGLMALAKRIEQVKAHGASQYNPGWHEALDLSSLLVCSEAVARAARMRQESRGAHSRVDFEGERDDWGKVNLVVRKADDGTMEIEKVERGEPRADLAEIALSTVEELVKMEGPTDG
ncbi:MAG: FAD-binding protein, partial [Myxococcota bacterium]